MKHCDLASGVGRLNKAMSQLREKWIETKSQWNDSASRQFEETHLLPILPQMQMVTAAIQRLAEVLEKAERDCEDPDAAGV